MNKNESGINEVFLGGIIILFFIMFLPFVSPAPPQISTNPGMQIEYPKAEYIRLGNEHRFHAHVINQSSIKTNKTTSCIFHLYNQTGYDISTGTTAMEFEDNYVDYAITISGGNFSSVGTYSYVIQCNSSNEIAFASAQLDITPSGSAKVSSGEGLILIASLLIILTIGIVSLIFGFKTENIVGKLTLFSFGGIAFLITLLYTMLIIMQYLATNQTIVSGFETSIFVGKILAALAVIILLIVIIMVGIKSWKIKRGYYED